MGGQNKYSNVDVAGWLGCNESRIRRLRKWAEEGFVGFYDKSHRATKSATSPNQPLESLDNPDDEEQVADPAGFIVAVTKNATDKANIAVRNIERDFTDDDRRKLFKQLTLLFASGLQSNAKYRPE